MTQKNHLNVNIANVALSVPIHENTETTKRIVANLEAKLRQIEDQSTRVDSQAFALQLAYEYAVQLQTLQKDKEQDNKDMLIALDALQSKLHELVNRHTEKE